MKSVRGQFIKNIFTTWAGMVINLAIAFLFTPYLISMLGKARYGIWSLIFSIVAYAALADLGMKQSIVRFVSKHLAKKEWKEVGSVISTAGKIYFIISMVILAATFVTAFGLLRYFKIPDEYFGIARTILLVLGINEAFRYFTIPFTSLGAFHRFDVSSYFNVGLRLTQTLGMIVLLELGYGLIEMAILVLGLNILMRFGMNSFLRKTFPDVKVSLSLIRSDKAKELINYGIISFLIVIAWTLIYYTDNIVIGAFLSVEAVAVYSVAAMIITQIRSSIQIVAVPLVPAVSHIDASEDKSKIMEIYERASKYLYYVSGFLAISFLLFGGHFILLWVGEEFIEAIKVLYILIIAGAVYLPQTMANSVLFGISKHKIAFYVLLAEGLSNIGLSLLLVKPYGIIGVALGTAIPQIIIYSIFYPIVFYKAMAAGVGKFYLSALKSLFWSIIFVLPAAYLVIRLIPPDGWVKFFIDCIIVTVFMLIGLMAVVLHKEDRRRIFDKVAGVFAKIGIGGGNQNSI